MCHVQMDLASELKAEGGKLTERKAVQKVVQPFLTALADLQSIGISHGAIVPHNMVYGTGDLVCKLAGKHNIRVTDAWVSVTSALTLCRLCVKGWLIDKCAVMHTHWPDLVMDKNVM